MANPQKEDGHIQIANEIWDAITKRKFSLQEQKVIRLLHRLSYGCGIGNEEKKVCFVDNWTDFECCAGVHRTMIKSVLEGLVLKQVIAVDWKYKGIAFNKNYDTWAVPLIPKLNEERYKNLISNNISYDEIKTAISKKLILLVKNYTYKEKTAISKKLTARQGKANDSVALRHPKDINNKGEKIEDFSPTNSEEIDAVVGMIQKATVTNWRPANQYQVETLEEIATFPFDRVKQVIERAGITGIKGNGVLSWIMKGLQNFEELYMDQPPKRKPSNAKFRVLSDEEAARKAMAFDDEARKRVRERKQASKA